MRDFINYNQALELKELGFDEPCFGIYNINMDILPIIDEPYTTTSKYGAILLSQAFRFFRDKKGLHVIYTMGDDWNNNYWQIWRNDTMTKTYVCSSDYVYETYEEAESACLDKLIELAKTK